MSDLEREEILKIRDQYAWMLRKLRPPKLIRMFCRQQIALCNRKLEESTT